MSDTTPTPDGLGGSGQDGGGLGGLFESAQQALTAQAEAASQVVEGTAGGGVVAVTMTGHGEVTSVTLAPEVVDPGDIEMLQDLIVAALHDAGTKVTELQREAMGTFGGFDLGSLGEVLGGLTEGGPAGAEADVDDRDAGDRSTGTGAGTGDPAVGPRPGAGSDDPAAGGR